MKYYIIDKQLAERLGLTLCRIGSEKKGYLVDNGDLAVPGINISQEAGVREVTLAEAREFVRETEKH